MFFDTSILLRNGGEFTIIWMLAHNKASKTPQSTINEVDVTAKCEALLKYLPTGQLTASEVRSKMSLYLLAILQHGIVIAFARKTDFTLHKLEEAINKFFKPQFQKPPTKRKALEDGKAKTKRTRRTAAEPEAEQVQEEVEGYEQLIDLRNLPNEEISDRLRVTDLRQITLNEYDQQPQGFFEPDLRDFEQLMQLEMDQRSEHSREAIDLADHEAGVTPFVETARQPRGFFEPDMHEFEQMMQLEMDRQSEHSREAVEPMVVDQGMLHASLQLPELTEAELANEIAEQQPRAAEPVRRRPRRRNLIVDQQIELSDDEIRQNLANYEDIQVDRRMPAPVKKQPSVRELLAPFPYHLPFGKEQFGPLHKGAIDAALENLARRAEGLDRQLEVNADQTNEPSAAEIARQSSARSPFFDQQQTFDPILGDLPVPDAAPIFDQLDELPESQVAVAPTMNESSIPLDNTHYLNDQGFEQNEMAPVENQVNEVAFVPAVDAALLDRIKSFKRGADPVKFSDFANKASKKTIARDFVNMLHLLKQRSVTVKQDVSYGPIYVNPM